VIFDLISNNRIIINEKFLTDWQDQTKTIEQTQKHEEQTKTNFAKTNKWFLHVPYANYL
jgi:hypothetical protein